MTTHGNRAQTMSKPLLLRVGEACEMLGIGRSKLYELIAVGDVEVLHIGSAVRVPVAGLEAFVERLRSEQGVGV